MLLLQSAYEAEHTHAPELHSALVPQASPSVCVQSDADTAWHCPSEQVRSTAHTPVPAKAHTSPFVVHVALKHTPLSQVRSTWHAASAPTVAHTSSLVRDQSATQEPLTQEPAVWQPASPALAQVLPHEPQLFELTAVSQPAALSPPFDTQSR
jgi:hypothetical protein